MRTGKPVPQLYVKNGWMCGHFVFRRRTFGKYPELKDKYSYTDDFMPNWYLLDHGFMMMQPRRQQKTNIRIQRQKGCLYVWSEI